MSSVYEDKSLKNIILNIVVFTWYFGSPWLVVPFMYFYQKYSWDNPYTIIFFILIAIYCVFMILRLCFLVSKKCIEFNFYKSPPVNV
jgi:hypothetical protein